MDISLELVLGILGSSTGIAALVIQVLKYLKERPKIKAQIKEHKHFYQPIVDSPPYTQSIGGSTSNYWLTFLIETLVRNKGDRATTIGDAILDFKIGKKEYRITTDDLKVRVESNDLVRVRPQLAMRFMNISAKQEKILFKLTLVHTHGEIKLDGTSSIVQ
jgi:hypothetical protein